MATREEQIPDVVVFTREEIALMLVKLVCADKGIDVERIAAVHFDVGPAMRGDPNKHSLQEVTVVIESRSERNARLKDGTRTKVSP